MSRYVTQGPLELKESTKRKPRDCSHEPSPCFTPTFTPNTTTLSAMTLTDVYPLNFAEEVTLGFFCMTNHSSAGKKYILFSLATITKYVYTDI